MQLPENPTLEDYRDAAHYWQKKWAAADETIKQLKLELAQRKDEATRLWHQQNPERMGQ